MSIIITASSQLLHHVRPYMHPHLYHVCVYIGSQPRRSMYSGESETACIHAEPPTFTNIYGSREHDACPEFQLSHMDPVTTPARDSTSPSVRSALRIPVAQSGKRAKPNPSQGRALLSTGSSLGSTLANQQHACATTRNAPSARGHVRRNIQTHHFDSTDNGLTIQELSSKPPVLRASACTTPATTTTTYASSAVTNTHTRTHATFRRQNVIRQDIYRLFFKCEERPRNKSTMLNQHMIFMTRHMH